ncbi:hypothetical protein K7X08_017486 [Anisodus acutangulus]|uniref:Diacylglycerol kinase accessory domain-containing protein n=1 Tax=Anisodus acutangulus TaxID=402998 RepID=A0A9Q1R7Y3_9SOLA|nr:hypothetical protein K7X08_017486 [Anisodus acutangulus]
MEEEDANRRHNKERSMESVIATTIVTLNLPSYGSGRNPWGNLKPEFLEKAGQQMQATAQGAADEVKNATGMNK